MNDKEYLMMAINWAKFSNDTTKVGSVIVKDDEVISSGYNMIPLQFESKLERYKEEVKLHWIEHAERVAIFNAKVSLENSTIYCSMFPCSDCARAIIQNKIKRVVSLYDFSYNGRWLESMKIAEQMFQEANVELLKVDKI